MQKLRIRSSFNAVSAVSLCRNRESACGSEIYRAAARYRSARQATQTDELLITEHTEHTDHAETAKALVGTGASVCRARQQSQVSCGVRVVRVLCVVRDE